MQPWLKFYEAITKPLPVASSLFLLLATSFLLLASDRILAKLGIPRITTDYRWLVGSLFIIAVSWLVVTALIWMCKRSYQAWSAGQAEKRLRQRLHTLTADERRILSGYVTDEVRTKIFHAAPDHGTAQGLAEDGILYKPDVVQDGPVAGTYNIRESALAYLSNNKELVASVVSAETRWSGTKRSPDWFARCTGLLAIALTVASLSFTQRTYRWQTKTYEENLEERIFMRLGFSQTWDIQRGIGTNQGKVEVEIVNIGMHPIYIRFVEILPPNGCEIMKVRVDPGISPDACGLAIYDYKRLTPNEHVKPLDPGDATNYTMEWDFSKFPLQEWVMSESSFKDHLWIRVDTTKKSFRQHPTFSWAQFTGTIPHGSQKDK